MDNVSVRDLRNNGGQILDRVAAGEAMTITRDGTPIAHLTPLPGPRLNAQAMVERWRTLPVLSAVTLAELSVGPVVARDENEQQRRQLVLQVTDTR